MWVWTRDSRISLTISLLGHLELQEQAVLFWNMLTHENEDRGGGGGQGHEKKSIREKEKRDKRTV